MSSIIAYYYIMLDMQAIICLNFKVKKVLYKINPQRFTERVRPVFSINIIINYFKVKNHGKLLILNTNAYKY